MLAFHTSPVIQDDLATTHPMVDFSFILVIVIGTFLFPFKEELYSVRETALGILFVV